MSEECNKAIARVFGGFIYCGETDVNGEIRLCSECVKRSETAQ